jgi:hypothetical protein
MVVVLGVVLHGGRTGEPWALSSNLGVECD